ncbi:MAG: carbohydrate ABC transporter permease, partial [Paenibacillus sp.]|nr:carbohydrate ABC transporter permease [Paenibacillus sp.]
MDTRLKQEQASIRKTPARKRSSSRDKGSLGERLFQIFNICFFIGMGLTTLIPFVNLIAKSFSSEAAVVSGSVNLFPIGFQIGTYRYVLQDILFIQSFRTSVIVTVLGTLLGLLFTTLTAYPLSKLRLRGRKWFLLYFIFTMLFSGGLIPTYLLMQELKLVNSIGVLFLPGMVNIFYLL